MLIAPELAICRWYRWPETARVPTLGCKARAPQKVRMDSGPGRLQTGMLRVCVLQPDAHFHHSLAQFDQCDGNDGNGFADTVWHNAAELPGLFVVGDSPVAADLGLFLAIAWAALAFGLTAGARFGNTLACGCVVGSSRLLRPSRVARAGRRGRLFVKRMLWCLELWCLVACA